MLDSKSGRLFIIVTSVLLVGFAIFAVRNTAPDKGQSNWPDSFASNGERLYFTGVGASGAQMVPRGGNHHMTMMGSGGCVDCHGTDRNGGRLWPSGWQIAPSITVAVLAGEHAQDGHVHEGYDNKTLARAITEGVRPDGSTLGAGMPRWSMPAEDLNDLIAFLLKL